jgi:uncharacterized protein
MITSSNDFMDQLKSKLDEIKHLFMVKNLGIYGSFAKGNLNQSSDIDVLVEFEHGHKTLDNLMGLKYYLEGLFQKEVDIVTKEALHPMLKDDILESVMYV